MQSAMSTTRTASPPSAFQSLRAVCTSCPASPRSSASSSSISPSTSPEPPGDAYAAVSDLRTTAARSAVQPPGRAMNLWPGTPGSSNTPTSHQAEAVGFIPASSAAQAARCVECPPAASCDDPSCADVVMDTCTDGCATSDCTDECMVVACTDPTHAQAPGQGSNTPCSDGRCSTPQLIDQLMGCWGPTAHAFFSTRPMPEDISEEIPPPLRLPHDTHQCDAGSNCVIHHAQHAFKASMDPNHPHFHHVRSAQGAGRPAAPLPNFPPTPPGTSNAGSPFVVPRVPSTVFENVTPLSIPQRASVSQRAYTCQWANCSLKFQSLGALVGHVNLEHLCEQSSTPSTSTSRPAVASQPSAPQPQPPLLQTAQTSVSPTFADLVCHWEGCQVTHPTLDMSLAGTDQSADSALNVLATHLLEDHLGLETSRFFPQLSGRSGGHVPHQQHGHHQMPLHHPLPQHVRSAHVTPSPTSPIRTSPFAGPSSSVSSEGLILASPPLSPSSDLASVPSSSGAGATGQAMCCWTGCHAVFADVAALTDHLDTAHIGAGKAHYDCSWGGCTRHGAHGFSSKQKIRRHLQSHTGHRPFICEICKQNFSEAATLQQHMRRHTQQKPYLCDFPGCGKAFTVAGALTIHKRTHNGQKPFRCTYCDKAFAESSNLSKHLRTHTGARPYSCSECDKAFARPDQLSRHMGVHRKSAAPEGAIA